ncbi:hypothetical protein BGW41_003160 [Actinomortierella wolfii]|nr:hypothetical protein BGW41_003160 [Actinomortierella wolfii]
MKSIRLILSALVTLTCIVAAAPVSETTSPGGEIEPARNKPDRGNTKRTPACCSALVKGYDGKGVGLECTSGGIDCAFSGQILVNCVSINELTNLHVGYDCVPA